SGDTLDLFPRIFPLLVIMNEAGKPARRHVLIAQFPKDLRAVIDVLISARLLSTEGGGETATVSLAHEKLFDAWRALRNWIGENQKDFFLIWRANIQAKEWE